MSIEICASKHLVVMGTYYPHMPIGKVWICRLLFVCMFFCNFVFVRLRISLLRITLAASNFSRWFMGVLGRESPILENFAPLEAQNQTFLTFFFFKIQSTSLFVFFLSCCTRFLEQCASSDQSSRGYVQIFMNSDSNNNDDDDDDDDDDGDDDNWKKPALTRV